MVSVVFLKIYLLYTLTNFSKVSPLSSTFLLFFLAQGGAPFWATELPSPHAVQVYTFFQETNSPTIFNKTRSAVQHIQ